MACGLEFLKRKGYQQALCLQDLHPHLDKYLFQFHVNIYGSPFKIGVIFLFIASIDTDLSFNTYTLNTIKVDMTKWHAENTGKLKMDKSVAKDFN